ncbi:hypothetical protein AA14337_3078 [Acetobacter malorum DSM 14337]|uniref:Uncharacterized protein n=1 Tax=Acetobacter malorum DSM 14337 TaxID=1307910 RepID=A0ABQ0PZI5_9PROT|nr:hypothetical protein [Acetobacter malorum]KXV05665.1 hypothetical protein AD930_11050 [Acetobacter malorum]GBQ85465.1 hypothetical protein AA14337_3078 [Acetobacter malorum DSM 14337]
MIKRFFDKILGRTGKSEALLRVTSLSLFIPETMDCGTIKIQSELVSGTFPAKISFHPAKMAAILAGHKKPSILSGIYEIRSLGDNPVNTGLFLFPLSGPAAVSANTTDTQIMLMPKGNTELAEYISAVSIEIPNVQFSRIVESLDTTSTIEVVSELKENCEQDAPISSADTMEQKEVPGIAMGAKKQGDDRNSAPPRAAVRSDDDYTPNSLNDPLNPLNMLSPLSPFSPLNPANQAMADDSSDGGSTYSEGGNSDSGGSCGADQYGSDPLDAGNQSDSGSCTGSGTDSWAPSGGAYN